MDLVKRSLSKWIQGAIILTIGILVIIVGAQYGNNNFKEGSDAAKAISLVLGIILLIVGGLSLLLAILLGVLAKKSFLGVAIPGGLLLAFGISLVSIKFAAGLIGLVVSILPYLLIVLGAIILADAIYTLVLAILGKQSLFPSIVSIVFGAVALVIGCLCVGADPVIVVNAQLVIFGIVMCLYACLVIVSTFLKVPTAFVAVVTKKEEKEESPAKEEKAE